MNGARAALAEKARMIAALMTGDAQEADIDVAAIAAAPPWLDRIAQDEDGFLALAGAFSARAQWCGLIEGDLVRALSGVLGEDLCDRFVGAAAVWKEAPGSSAAQPIEMQELPAAGRGVVLAALEDLPPGLAGLMRWRWRGEIMIDFDGAPEVARWTAAWAAALMQDQGANEEPDDELHAAMERSGAAAEDTLASP